MPINALRTTRRLRRPLSLVAALLCVSAPRGLAGQDVTGAQAGTDSATVVAGAAIDSAAAVVAPLPPPGLPLFLTLGAGYGQRSDPCAQCTSPDNTDSFTGHLSIGKYLGYGLGVGVDASVWKRGHPGPRLAPDSLGVSSPTSLSNMLGNASLSLSLQAWHVFVRGGIGLAWGSQDFESLDLSGDPAVVRASGKGIGYSAGGGLTLPLASMVSLAVFANWNVGTYDLASPEGVLQRDAEHEYLEVGFGLTIR